MALGTTNANNAVTYSGNSKMVKNQVIANSSAVTTLSTAQVRNIYAGTSDMTAGTTALTTGDIYVVYEA